VFLQKKHPFFYSFENSFKILLDKRVARVLLS